MSLTAQAAAGVKWTALSNWVSVAFSFLTFVVLSRILQPADFGLFALCMVVVAVSLTLFAAVFREPLVQRTEIGDLDTSTAFWTTVVLGGGVATALALAAPGIASLFDNDDMAVILRAMAIKVFADAIGSVPTAILMRRLAFAKLSIQIMVANLAAGMIAMALAFQGFGVWALAAQQIFIAAAGAALVFAFARWRPKPMWSASTQRSYLPFSASAFGWQLLDLLNQQFDRAVIGSWLGHAALGLYVSGRRMHELVLEVVASSVSYVALPIFSSLKDDVDRARRGYLKAVSLIALVSAPASLGVVAVAPAAVPLILGETWAPAAPIVQLFALTGMLRAIGMLQSVAVRSMGRPDWWLAYLLAQNVANVAVVLIFVRYGLYWTVVAIVCREIAVWPVAFTMARRVLEIRVADYVGAFFRPLAAAVAMLGAIGLWEMLLRPPALEPWVGLAADVALGVCVYGVLSLAINRAAVQEALATIHRVVAKPVRP